MTEPSSSRPRSEAGVDRPASLCDEPGRTFRVPPRWYAEVSANLSIANMDFADFADSVDASGVFQGFERA
ncbi:DUF6924 domain-containing protein [Micromonospora gifhornensis]|uniref:DUF6924 domain-containing protein n=1 Tax=Micromonospora gifhornensis TaxID=84594 RepID=UPI0035710B4A